MLFNIVCTIIIYKHVVTVGGPSDHLVIWSLFNLIQTRIFTSNCRKPLRAIVFCKNFLRIHKKIRFTNFNLQKCFTYSIFLSSVKRKEFNFPFNFKNVNCIGSNFKLILSNQTFYIVWILLWLCMNEKAFQKVTWVNICFYDFIRCWCLSLCNGHIRMNPYWALNEVYACMRFCNHNHDNNNVWLLIKELEKTLYFWIFKLLKLILKCNHCDVI